MMQHLIAPTLPIVRLHGMMPDMTSAPCTDGRQLPDDGQADRGPAGGKAEAGGMGSWPSGKTGPCPHILRTPKSGISSLDAIVTRGVVIIVVYVLVLLGSLWGIASA